MIFARIMVKYIDGRFITEDCENQLKLGERLNYFQDAIFAREVSSAMVEPVDPNAQPMAEMFNNMASDIDKLRNTQNMLKNS